MNIEPMYLTEQHYINKSHHAFEDCDHYAWLSKNLYNSVLYIYRQEYFRAKNANEKAVYPNYAEINKQFIKEEQDQLFCFGDKPDNFKFSGTRKYRGLYVTKDKLHINADMNGAVNIMRKVIQDVEQSTSWIRGCVVSPIKYSIALR